MAFGTSAPELAINITAGLRGQSGISFGNVVGSNIANIALVLGASALIAPLRILPTVSRREIPLMVVATLAVVIMSFDTLRGAADDRIGRIDGVLLLLGFFVFLFQHQRESQVV